jgi:pimeloyl-ACP methyl ester carboxylesterase/class 3 adenylate cyclase
MTDRPRTRYARSGELDIAYQVLGEGSNDLVVVPPGLSVMEPSWDWPAMADFWHQLATSTRLIRLDKRGTGLSDRVTGVPTVEERMDDVRAVMDAVGSERAAIFGASEGAPIATLFAATYPERVASLILFGAIVKWLAAPDFPWGYTNEQQQGMFRYLADQWGSGLSGESFFAPSLAKDPRGREYSAALERQAGTPGAVATFIAMDAEIDIRPVLPTVTVPTLVIHRTGDSVVRIEQGRYYADWIHGAKMLELPGDDHWFWTGDAHPVVEAILEFVTGGQPVSVIDRVLKTVLFTDIVGSTERAVELGDERWKNLLDSHDQAVRDELRRFRGTEVNTTGDGFLAAFDGPARAIRCAQAITAGAHGLGVEVRAGLHTGECELRGDDLAGIAVHIGARVAALAGPGEVLVTSTVRDLVAGSGIEFTDRGPHVLKGVPDEWNLLAVAP